MWPVVGAVVVEHRPIARRNGLDDERPEALIALGELVDRDSVSAGVYPRGNSGTGELRGDHHDVENDVIAGGNGIGDQINLRVVGEHRLRAEVEARLDQRVAGSCCDLCCGIRLLEFVRGNRCSAMRSALTTAGPGRSGAMTRS